MRAAPPQGAPSGASRPSPRPRAQAVCESTEPAQAPAAEPAEPPPLAEWDVLGDVSEYEAQLARENVDDGSWEPAEAGGPEEFTEAELPADVLEMMEAAPEAAEALRAAFIMKSAERFGSPCVAAGPPRIAWACLSQGILMRCISQSWARGDCSP